MTQQQFTQFLSDNNCLDKYMNNYNNSPFKECEFERWFDMVDKTNLITAAFMYPTNQYGLWIDLNNKYKEFLKDLDNAQST
jgi:hypothetical protein